MKSEFVEVKGLKYHYIEIPNPTRPKLLLIHGVIVESHVWEKMFEFLTPFFYIYAIDLKGHGLSDNGQSYNKDYTPEIISQDLYEFYQKVIQEPFYLAGYSLGGQFGLKYAADHPETVKKLVILDSAPSVPMRGIFALLVADAMTPKKFQSQEQVLSFYNKRLEGLGEYMLKYAVKPLGDGTYALRYDKANVAPKTMMDTMRRNKVLWNAAKSFKKPTLLIKAGKSQIINTRIVSFMKAAMPHLVYEEIPGVGHEFVMSAPREVSEVMLKFLNAE